MTENILQKINDIVWGPFTLCLLAGVGLFYTVKLGFFQFTHFGFWWKNTFMSLFKKHNGSDGAGVSPLKAVSTALAGSVGTGNIVGVANAVALGGAGAVFWMWIASFLGMATVLAENVLGVKYRVRLKSGFSGGPMYYIEKGLGCKWLAAVFAVFCTLASLGMGNMTQGNSVAGALENGFGIPVHVTGAVLSVVTWIIIFGGIGRISGFTEKLVPVMTLLYIGVILFVISVNINNVPSALREIFEDAFSLKSASGGITGFLTARALRYGISRGVFSNEAGLGTSPIIHAAADTDNPYRQGLWGIFQVFIDTTLLCTLMALCILASGGDKTGLDGIALCSYAFEHTAGAFGSIFLSLSLALFAFGTLISWSYYGEKSLEYLTAGRFILPFRILYSAVVYIGCVTEISAVWQISDTLNGLMALPNLAALILLSGKVKSSELKRFVSDNKGRTFGTEKKISGKSL